MLLTKRFTYIHEPKTGGTFVTHALTRLHGGLIDVRPTRRRGPLLRRLGLAGASFYAERRRGSDGAAEAASSKYGPLYNWNDHGTCSEIPFGRPSRPILATVRHPFETYVSLYRFGWWRRPEFERMYETRIERFRERFPGFPEVGFADFLELLHAECVIAENRELSDRTRIGYLSERFLRYYFRLPRTIRGSTYDLRPVVEQIVDANLDDGDFRDGMYDVRFIHTAELYEELRAALLELGYEPEDLEFLQAMKRVQPTEGTNVRHTERSEGDHWRDYFTAELTELMRIKDRFFFAAFPELEDPRPS